MKRLSLSVLALGLVAAAPSHALFGVGISLGKNTTNVAGEDAVLGYGALPTYLQSFADSAKKLGNNTDSVLVLSRNKVSGLQQIGAKVWLDIPLTDITVDASSNIAWGSYSSVVSYDDGINAFNVDASMNTGFPVWGIGKNETPYINLLNDLTLRYNFLNLPPVISLVKISAGGGVTLAYGTRVVGKDDIKDLFGTGTAAADPEAVKAELTKRLSDNLYTTKWGGHLDLNVTVKPPVIPLAVYAEGKWYINTATTKAADNFPFAVTAGLAFAL